MYLGRYMLGQHVPLAVVTINGARTPSWPTNVPIFTVYDASGTRVISGKMPPMDLARLTGSFDVFLRLGSSFSSGQHTAIMTWVLGSTTYRSHDRFEVVAGGDANGGLISAYYYRRPHADFIVGKLDSSQRVLARDPEE